MQKDLLYAPVYVAPSQEELRAMLGDRVYTACKAVRDFAHANYEMEERWRYSDKRDAFDCLIYDGDKRLCSLHLREGRLSFLVMFSQDECAAIASRPETLRPAVRAYYEAAHVEEGVRWVRVPQQENATLEDIYSLIRLKAKLTGMENISPQNTSEMMEK